MMQITSHWGMRIALLDTVALNMDISLVKVIYSCTKDPKISTNKPPAQILNAVNRGASEAALLHLPKPTSFKRALNKAKNVENPRV